MLWLNSGCTIYGPHKDSFPSNTKHLTEKKSIQRWKDMVRNFVKLRLCNVVTTLTLNCLNVAATSLLRTATTLSTDVGKLLFPKSWYRRYNQSSNEVATLWQHLFVCWVDKQYSWSSWKCPNRRTTSSRRRFHFDITLMCQKENIKSPRHFDVLYRCNFDEQEIGIIPTYFFNVISMGENLSSFRRTFFEIISMDEKLASFRYIFFGLILMDKNSTLFRCVFLM